MLKNIVLNLYEWYKFFRRKYHYSKELKGRNISKLTKKEYLQVRQFYTQIGFNFKFNYRWFEYYKYYNGYISPYYLPKDLWKYMEPILNPVKYRFFQHKGLLNRFLDKIYLPLIYVNKMFGVIYDTDYNIITEQQAIEILIKKDKFIFKPTKGTGGGKGVELLEFVGKDDEYREKILKKIISGDNFVCQEVIVPSKKISKYNRYDKTVNTIRCFTLCLNGVVSVLSSYMRMGGYDVINDNVSMGTKTNFDEDTASSYVGVKSNGELNEFALTRINMNKKQYKSPSGILLSGERLDFYEKVKSVVIAQHEKLPMLGFVAWDITIDDNDNIRIIEINLDSQDIEDHHIFNGAIFEARFNELIEYLKK